MKENRDETNGDDTLINRILRMSVMSSLGAVLSLIKSSTFYAI